MHGRYSNKQTFLISKFRHDRNRIIGLLFYDSNYIKGWLYQKGSQNSFIYRDCSKFHVNKFRRALKESLTEVSRDDKEFSEIHGRFKMVLNEHAPIKKKCIQANDGAFMTKPFERQFIPAIIIAIDTIRAEAKKTGMLLKNNAISVLKFCGRLNLTIKRDWISNV